jgi:hypothetical protein
MLDNFVFRIVQWPDGLNAQINCVCKRCLAAFYVKDVFELFRCCESHDCKTIKVANFNGIPTNLK